MPNKNITSATWEEFKDTGLLLMINQLLQFFGWSIMYRYDEDMNIIEVIPIRTKFRGYSDKSILDANKKFIAYMQANTDTLKKEVEETE
jgi:hypothetical protein